MKEILTHRIAALLAEIERPGLLYEVYVGFFTHNAPLPDAENPKIKNPIRRAQWALGQEGKFFIQSSLKKSVLFSVSHSSFQDSSTVIVFGAAADPGLVGVGIDLERLDREVSAGVAEKFILSTEKNLPLLPIELFSLKEAAFKSNPKNQNTVISQYEVSPRANFSEIYELKGPGLSGGRGSI